MARELSEFGSEQVTEFFEYLDALRLSGVTNMYGAGTYLEKEFGLNHGEAREALLNWMRTFSEGTLPERVESAMSKAA